MYKREGSYVKRFEDEDGLYLKEAQFFYNDWELSQEIQEAIEEDEYISEENKQDLQVVVEKGLVVLKGRVSTYEDKMKMGVIASAFVGFEDILNQIHVISAID